MRYKGFVYREVILIRFQGKLPYELPSHRHVKFKMTMKPNVQPSNRPPFRLPQFEQVSYRFLVEERFAKGWIEVLALRLYLSFSVFQKCNPLLATFCLEQNRFFWLMRQFLYGVYLIIAILIL